jgi:hypothetical protein
MGDYEDLIEQINAHCVGHPHAKIAWPHRLLHDCRDAIATLTRERDEEIAKRQTAEFYAQEKWNIVAAANLIADRDAAIARAEDKSELASLALATRDEWEREALALRALLRETGEALHLFQQYGCPVCHGDCASANPPVLLCPMQTAHDLAARITAATQTETGGEDDAAR